MVTKANVIKTTDGKFLEIARKDCRRLSGESSGTTGTLT